jgi:hypothetical protein
VLAHIFYLWILKCSGLTLAHERGARAHILFVDFETQGVFEVFFG